MHKCESETRAGTTQCDSTGVLHLGNVWGHVWLSPVGVLLALVDGPAWPPTENDQAPVSWTLQYMKTEPRFPCHPLGQRETWTLSDSSWALSPQTTQAVSPPPRKKQGKGAASIPGEGRACGISLPERRRISGWFLEAQVQRRKLSG